MSNKTVPLHEVIALLESGSNIDDLEIILFSPDDGNNTEEESGDEAENDFNHLPRSVLRSEVEVAIEGSPVDNLQIYDDVNRPESDPDFEPDWDSDHDISNQPSTSKPKSGKKRKVLKRKMDTNYRSDESYFTKKSGLVDGPEVIKNYDGPSLSHVECFEKMFTSEVFDLLVEMSNMYASYKNHDLHVTVKEMKVFVAILMLSGYLSPKYMRMFWEEQSDTYNKLVAQSMRRDQFFEIQQYLHLCDNQNLPKNDKFAKVRKYFSLLSQNFTDNFDTNFSSHISIDESMVPYYGRHGSKQHIRGKPIRFGYKVWSMATRGGYLISFEPYQGSKSSPLPLQDEYGLGASVVLELSSRLPSSSGPYNFYVDNFFSGLPLVRQMTVKGYGFCGTIRENRTEKCPLPPISDMKKTPRGSVSIRAAEDLCIVRWNDNNIVTVISNCHGINPIHKVERIGFVEKKKQKITVDCPNIIAMYNRYMLGVDRFDENVASLRCSLKGRKWWYPLFVFGLDASCQNGWQLRKKFSSDTYCDFRRAVVQTYCFENGSAPKRIRSISNVPQSKLKNKESSTSDHDVFL